MADAAPTRQELRKENERLKKLIVDLNAELTKVRKELAEARSHVRSYDT